MISDLVAQMVSQLEAVVESSDYEIDVWPGMVLNPSQGTMIDVYPDDPFRDAPTGGMGDVNGGYQFVVRARTGLNDLDSGQSILLDLMDDDSEVCVAHAIADDPTLGGWASDVFVGDPSGFRAFASAEGTLVGVQWPVLVLAAQS